MLIIILFLTRFFPAISSQRTTSSDADPINVGFIATNFFDINTNEKNEKMVFHLRRLLQSIFSLSSNESLAFFMISDQSSVAVVQEVI